MTATNLTRKQKKFVKEYVKTEGNGTQAALVAYDTDSEAVAAVISNENLKKPKILDALHEALPDDLLAKIHIEGLFATKPIYNSKGDLVAEDADFAVRHKYLDSAYKIKDKYAAEKHINVNVEVEASPEVAELTKKLNDVYRGTSSRSDGGPSSSVGTQASHQD